MRITSGHRLTATRASRVVATDSSHIRTVILPPPVVERLGATNIPVAAVRAIPVVGLTDAGQESARFEEAARVCEGEWLPAGSRDAVHAQHGQSSAIQHYQQMLVLARKGGQRWVPSIDEQV